MILVSMKDITKEWLKENMVVIVAAVIILGLLGVAISRSAEPVKQPGPSSILILRESVVFDPNYGNVLLIDYMIDGWQTNAFFRPGEEEKLDKFWAELDKLGEVRR